MASKLKECIFSLRQFWEFFIVMRVYWISQSITWSLQDSICFELLGTSCLIFTTVFYSILFESNENYNYNIYYKHIWYCHCCNCVIQRTNLKISASKGVGD